MVWLHVWTTKTLSACSASFMYRVSLGRGQSWLSDVSYLCRPNQYLLTYYLTPFIFYHPFMQARLDSLFALFFDPPPDFYMSCKCQILISSSHFASFAIKFTIKSNFCTCFILTYVICSSDLELSFMLMTIHSVLTVSFPNNDRLLSKSIIQDFLVEMYVCYWLQTRKKLGRIFYHPLFLMLIATENVFFKNGMYEVWLILSIYC